ncbi:M14 family zinc carboxypeptidase [Hymenobacter psychrophilus]|uniref:Zinc carboxypeptidase n=1 Tax=Hymenobacter psychrophilus TaxID=651662 RepID=A0A1H3MV51_9BACT|nr:M14 family zinc carboxypeptidase [Hymenobacter psychrophilus]SDY80330.1 Zinc carboxypeptidase [Hymenobacter psychrophilus]
MLKFTLLTTVLALLAGPATAQTGSPTSYYFPGTTAAAFDPAVPTPEQFLGYPIGTHYTRTDQIVAYLRELDRVSDKVSLRVIGTTFEERPQVVATITAAENQQNLARLQQARQALVDPSRPAPDYRTLPVVVSLNFGVHGNESSSSEAALLLAYYLTASTAPETKQWLEQAVVTIDPLENPDGRDRASHWFDQNKSWPNPTDPLDREHTEAWPGGRTNHFYTDLNRDWLSLTQPESRARMAFFHEWYPNVMIDFHEMGTNSTYYFEPSKPFSTENALIPRATYEVLNVHLAKYFVRALDNLGSLYWTKEQFDNLSPIYGSTYPDFQGGVGVTFEVGSSRGLAQEGSNGVVTFPFTIRNHVATGLATVKGAVEEKELYLRHQRDFFASALTEARKFPTKAYVFGNAQDATLTNRFLALLLQHRVQVHTLSTDVTLDKQLFKSGQAYVVPTTQPQYRVVHSLFEELTTFHDSVFYDVTGWSQAHAYGLPFARQRNTALVQGAPVTAVPIVAGIVRGGQSRYAYLLPWSDNHAPRALVALQRAGVTAKVSFKPFRAGADEQKATDFGYGTLVIPVAAQSLPADSVFQVVSRVGRQQQVTFTGVSTGFSLGGIDLGSNNVRTVPEAKAALLVGPGLNASEVGEAWFVASQQLNLPLTRLELSNFGRAPLGRYTTLVLVGGSYVALDQAAVDKLRRWVQEGGTLITIKNASEWALKQGIVKEKLLIPAYGGWADTTALAEAITEATPPAPQATRRPRPELPFARRADFVSQEQEGTRAIAGSIYRADVDPTNPIGFGLPGRQLYVFRNGTTFLRPSRNPYATVVQYTPAPLVSGYVSRNNLRQIRNSAAVVVSKVGSGRVVLFADDPNFRHYWHGTSRLFVNALLLGPLLNLPDGPAAIAAEEE